MLQIDYNGHILKPQKSLSKEHYYFQLYTASSASTVIISTGLLNETNTQLFCDNLPPARAYFLITDKNVAPLIRNHPFLKELPSLIIETGEQHKSLEDVGKAYDFLSLHQADRGACLICIGGGIITDMGGFIAATYMRGISCVAIPTTLLSSVDASIGGKTGINHKGVKNLVGVFKQPNLVWCDPHFLTSLPDLEFLSGLGEVIKHAALASSILWNFLETNVEAILERDHLALIHCITESISIKGGVVESDPTEQGLRRLLNFGHTLGHAIETLYSLPHGMAISIGMNFSAYISHRKKYLSSDAFKRLQNLIEEFGLPISLKHWWDIKEKEMPTFVESEEIKKILDKIKLDKKRQGDSLSFILLSSLGHSFVEDISFIELEEALCDIQFFS